MAKKDIKILFGKSNPVLVQNICDFLKVHPCDASISSFPDGESSVVINTNIQDDDVFIIQSCDFPANQNYMELFIMIDAARRASAGRITAVLPFFGYSRQDRKDKLHVPITAKLIANLLTTAGADRVLTLDLHSQQIAGFFDTPVEHLFALPLFVKHLKNNTTHDLVVCAPDLGRTRMAVAYADVLHCDFGVVVKRRINGNCVKALNITGDVSGRDILLTDDMCVTFNTLDEAAKLLKRAGARSVRAIVTHCLLTEDGYLRLQQGNVDELITTNSTSKSHRFHNCPKITILNIGELLGKAVLDIHNGKNVTN
ncbi:MAG: ribose-phosphate diphosphokinase, partial [Opitutales bacterium]|nr:ribose-phosphate diphosphokinase [Opitutales bacterium]